MKAISFDTISIEAIRAGKKTMTRRPIKECDAPPLPPNIVARITFDGRFYNMPRWQVDDEAWVKTGWTDAEGKVHPAMYMKRVDSPFRIRITAQRIERLQDITAVDVEREGIDLVGNLPMVPSFVSATKSIEYIAKYLFHDRWARIYEVMRPRSYRFWDFNPWVEVLTFEVIEVSANG